MSSLGYPFICFPGDIAGEAPYYSREHAVREIAVMAAWCENVDKPVIYDIGANNGFVSSQLAQILRPQSPQIFAFEPVPTTYAMLWRTVHQLRLESFISPVSCGFGDTAGVVTIAYDVAASLFAQIRADKLNTRAGSTLVRCPVITASDATNSLGVTPSLIKIDVEGYELQVLRGAAGILAAENPPALCLEWNPLTMNELKNSPADVAQLLRGYSFIYIDDFEGQRLPFGQVVQSTAELDWVCNLLCVPESAIERSYRVIARAQSICAPIL
jgi:FkbM family methyltransferase